MPSPRSGSISGRCATSTRGHDACTASHRVSSVEELRVEAGSLEAARIDSSLRCGTAVQVDWISWVASEVGVARFEMCKPGGFVALGRRGVQKRKRTPTLPDAPPTL